MTPQASVTKHPFDRNSITIPPSKVVTEWKRLQEQYGESAEAMPQLYEHIEGLRDGFLKEGLLSVLVTQWVSADARGGFEFFQSQRKGDYRREEAMRIAFVEEWLRADSPQAMEEIKAIGKGWASHLGDAAIVLAQQEPDFFIANFGQIAVSISGQDTEESALSLLAEHDYRALRDAAIAAQKKKRGTVFEKAIGSAARVWAAQDGEQALRWVDAYEGAGVGYALEGALAGLASVNPMEALREGFERVEPRSSSSSSVYGFVSIAAAQDLEGTLSWYLDNRSQSTKIVALDYAMGAVVAKELAKDPTSFLNGLEKRGQFAALLTAFNGMISGVDYSARWQEISNWLSKRPESASKNQISADLARSLAAEDPPAAFTFVDSVENEKLRLKLRKEVAAKLLNTPSLDTVRFYSANHPEWSQELILAAFGRIGSSAQQTGLPQYPLDINQWVTVAEELDGQGFRSAAGQLAKGYLLTDPTAALEWMERIPAKRLDSKERDLIFSNALGSWLWENEDEAIAWIARTDLGPFHDQTASKVVSRLSDRKAPIDEVWSWFESISQEEVRKNAFRSLNFSYGKSLRGELSKRLQESNFSEEEKGRYLEKLSSAKGVK